MTRRMRWIILLAVLLAVAAAAWLQSRGNTGSSITAAKSGITTTIAQSVRPEDAPAACPRGFTGEETEGPYYKAGSPEAAALADAGTPGLLVTVTGFVFDSACKPAAGAWLDFWQADDAGAYDNTGFHLRGHQSTNAGGRFVLSTVVPGEYPGRTNHIHVKIRTREGGPVTTTQIYFPGPSRNGDDGIFDPAMLVALGKDGQGRYVAFKNFKVK